MALSFKELIKPQYLRHIPSAINTETTNYLEIKLLRMLLGTCIIKCDYPSILVKQNKNYCNALNTIHTSVTPNLLKLLLYPITFDELSNYLLKTRNINRPLLNELLSEFSFYFIYKERESHASSFIHLYRILEHISYAFPLMHASMSNNYQGTFTSLKSYFTKDGGELNFLNLFLHKLFDGDPIYSTSADFTIPAPDSIIQQNIYSSFKLILPHDKVIFDDTRKIFSIKYSNMISILILIRNKYFHFALGGAKNIRSSNIEYPDLFFETINENFLNWLAIIYFEITKLAIDKWK